MKQILVTGASSGIGEALARLFAKRGYHLLLSGRNQSKLENLAQELGGESIIADLNTQEGREALVRVIKEKVPDIVINNAGFGVYGDVFTIPIAEQLAILEVDAAAPLELTLEAVQALKQAKKGGVVMNISSVAGDYPCPGMSVYGASKAFLTSFSRAIHTELRGSGISVLVSCPGMVESDFASRAAKKRIGERQKPYITAQFAAEQIYKQIQKNKEKYIFNWQYRVSSFLANYLLPTVLVKRMIWNRIKQRI